MAAGEWVSDTCGGSCTGPPHGSGLSSLTLLTYAFWYVTGLMDRLSGRQYKDVAMKKVFIVRLTEAERVELEALVRKGKASALAIARARILLKADQGKDGEAATDAEIAEALSVAAKTVFNVRRRCV